MTGRKVTQKIQSSLRRLKSHMVGVDNNLGVQDPSALVLSGKFDTGCTELVAGELQLPGFTLQAFAAAEVTKLVLHTHMLVPKNVGHVS